MTATAQFPGFYRGAINLWVEDPLTRDYLRKVWQDDPAVIFYVGGGKDGASAIVNEAATAGLANVFAYVDRDFGQTNRPNWANAASGRRLVSSVHETENHLLDPDALAGCTLNTGQRTPAQIAARLQQQATLRQWWMAARMVIAEVKTSIHHDFPVLPAYPAVADQATAEAYLGQLPWWNHAQNYVASLTTAHLNGRLAEHHASVAAWLAGADWRTEFPGKELFREVRGWIYDKPPNPASSAVYDADLAKSVGEWQAANNQVPQELSELLAALKARTGVP